MIFTELNAARTIVVLSRSWAVVLTQYEKENYPVQKEKGYYLPLTSLHGTDFLGSRQEEMKQQQHQL